MELVPVDNGYINRVDKVWGRECWIVNNELYCAKILHICCGRMSSLHYHKVKDETFHVLEGSCYLEIQDIDGRNICMLKKGDSIRLRPATVHRFFCTPEMTLGCKVLEISTRHSDDDVVRLEESKCLEE